VLSSDKSGLREEGEKLLWHITLFLRGFGAAIVICETDGGGAVQLANYFDLVGWRAWRVSDLAQNTSWEEGLGKVTGEWLGEHDLEAFARGLGSYHTRHVDV
jgi:hypothetical protein